MTEHYNFVFTYDPPAIVQKLSGNYLLVIVCGTPRKL